VYTPSPEKKNISNIIDCHLKKGYPIIIIFGTNISGTAGRQTTVHYSTSHNVCSCTTWENSNRRNWIKMQYYVGFVSPGSAAADSECGKKLDSYLIASCVGNTGVKNY